MGTGSLPGMEPLQECFCSFRRCLHSQVETSVIAWSGVANYSYNIHSKLDIAKVRDLKSTWCSLTNISSVHGKLYIGFSPRILRHIHILDILRNTKLIHKTDLFVLTFNSFQYNPRCIISVSRAHKPTFQDLLVFERGWFSSIGKHCIYV